MKITHISDKAVELNISQWVILFSYGTPVAALSPEGQEYYTSLILNSPTNTIINRWLRDKGSADCVDQLFFDYLTGTITICKES